MSVHLPLVYFYFHKLLWWLTLVCLSFVIVLHAFNSVKLLSQLRSAPVSHSPSALIVTNTVYGPSCALQKEVLVIHRWFLCLFLLMLGFLLVFKGSLTVGAVQPASHIWMLTSTFHTPVVTCIWFMVSDLSQTKMSLNRVMNTGF